MQLRCFAVALVAAIVQAQIPSDMPSDVPSGTPIQAPVEDGATSRMPSTMPVASNLCFICGEGRVVGNPDGVISGGDQTATCGEASMAGLSGMIPAFQCPLVQGIAPGLCDCREAGSPTAAPVFTTEGTPSASPVEVTSNATTRNMVLAIGSTIVSWMVCWG
jgi:hypothetical protein